MPELKLQHVVSVSSEDRGYPAENLLKCEGFKKWKSKNTGEKQVTATFQLEKSSKVSKIDIGNEGSAFVEVLVGKSSAKDGEFQVVLVASSFMNPGESRSGQNTTRVRMFGEEQLSKVVIGDNWDMVKVVCTQPFNKNIQYGLSFIKLHSPGGDTVSSSKQTTLGGFKVKAEEEDDIKPGSLFANRGKEAQPPAPLTGAAAARAASRLVDDSKTATTTSPATAKRKLSDSADKPEPQTKAPLRKHSTSHSSSGGTPVSQESRSEKKKKEERPPLKKMKTEPPKLAKEKEFNRLMERVTFVLSGFQNPERGKLRDRAMEMGATYKGDWGRGCTHLICAFENTPKYNQVRGKGRIVKKDWIRDCYKQRKLFPWRDYRLGKARSPPPTSDEGSDSEPDDVRSRVKPKQKSPAKAAAAAAEDYDGSTDADDSEEDTEKPRKDSAGKSPADQDRKEEDHSKGGDEQENIYEASTDEEAGREEEEDDDNDVESDGLPLLPDLFAGKHFFLYGKYPATERRVLNRFIIAYNGCVEEYMGDSVNYILTDSDWDDGFDDALSDNANLVFVCPDWIHACDKRQKLVPYQKYNVVPN